MKLTKKDKNYLLSVGHLEDDFSQIEFAMQRKHTLYELEEKNISREEAIRLLGRERYLSGIGRSAFHFSAVQDTDDGRVVYFWRNF